MLKSSPVFLDFAYHVKDKEARAETQKWTIAASVKIQVFSGFVSIQQVSHRGRNARLVIIHNLRTGVKRQHKKTKE